MYIIRTIPSEGETRAGFFSDHIEDLASVLTMDPTLVRQLKLTPEDQMYIARNNLIAALAMNNPHVEVALYVMSRFWKREAYDLIKLNMDDATYRIFRDEVNKQKLIVGGFEDERDADKRVWDRIKDIVLDRN